LYDPSGVSFGETSPIYFDHVGIEIGRVLVISREGDRFTALGWVHPTHADAVRDRRHVSPGYLIEAGEIVQFGGSDVLAVSQSWFLELSVTAEPSREGTTLSISGPHRAPSPDWEVLQTPASAFDALRVDREKFSLAAY
jgi:hypothetical protein